MHTGQLVLAVNCRKPTVEEYARVPWFIGLYEVQRCGGIVEDSIDEDFEVGKAEGGSLPLVDVVYGYRNNVLQALHKHKKLQMRN